jgi:flagellar biosynthesis/type III secretory pathway chaperone
MVYLMTDLLQKKHGLYRRLKANMEGFKRALEEGQDPQINQLTREREEILKTIDLVDIQLAREGYPNRRSIPGDKKGEPMLSNWIGKIKETWQEIFDLNLECLQYAEVRCRDLKQEMATLGREVQGVKRYIPPQSYSPRFVDMVK